MAIIIVSCTFINRVWCVYPLKFSVRKQIKSTCECLHVGGHFLDWKGPFSGDWPPNVNVNQIIDWNNIYCVCIIGEIYGS